MSRKSATYTYVGHKTEEFYSRWVAQLAECPTENPGTILTQVRVPGAARAFSPRVNFQCRLSDGVRLSLIHI